ncbi:MAG: hypothetical protein ACK4ND_01570 [Cytophagaceae bacterium]
MSFKYLPALILLTIWAFSFCNRKSTSNFSDQVTPVVINPNFEEYHPYSDLEILSASIDGDVLSVEIQCKGCGKDQGFDMVNNKNYMKSMPPGTTLYPVKLPCKTKNDVSVGVYKFDITAIKYPGVEQVWIVIPGYDHRINYNYK